ncbi:ABC transporter substrate-binding protein [Ruixingdingia sedimenti]|uniref:Extracellular solute-binding protein n=1 Tax=Ruixingdingia sedimenti TaxID=3073604 RepID=A0ABU1F3S9_9RHOB|nr:extracellular solute-binding protein [Xinfangfangia sp. LG-4]MDR5651529.1 extracellular solute-binding protein [Xinfangfangia sp. LG-4]
MRHTPLSRRRFMQGTAGSVALAAGGMPLLGAQQAFAADLASQELRTVGLSVTVQERILNDFKAASGVRAVSGKADIFPNTQTELLSGSTAYDCWETIAERLPSIVQTGLVAPIPADRLSNWTNIGESFTKPSDKWAPSEQIVGQIWTDESQTALNMVPTVYNFDSIGFRPDLVDPEEASMWTSLFDSKYRGKTGINVDPLLAFGQAIMALNELGELEVKNPGNPDAAAIEEAVKFLISKKKEGQFRALWGDFGEAVNLMASGEMIISDAWQPAVMAVKAQGVPCAYATMKTGYRGWAIGVSALKSSPNFDAVTAYADYWLSGPPAVAVSEQGYYAPNDKVKEFMSPEKYAFWYEGAPWVGAEERGIKEGDLRDGGSLATRAANVAYWHQWPDEYDLLIQKWDEFLSA